MSRNLDTKDSLCGNCKHFVAGGLCELVRGNIKAKDTCDLFSAGQPQSMDTKVNPTHNKHEANYRPGFFVETVSGDFTEDILQMEHDLLSRGIPEEEVHRATVAYFSQQEPPAAMPWPGPVTGVDLAGRIDPFKVVSTVEPLTDFRGLPNNVEPYPTPNVSPYGIGSYPNNPTPDPNSIGGMSHTYDFKNNAAPQSDVWDGLASDVNSEPSMHNEYGFNVATTIPTFPNDYEALHNDLHIHSKGIEPSGAISEAKTQDKKKKYLERLAKWSALLGGAAGMGAIIKKYLDSGTDKPLKIIAEYEYHGHDSDDECYPYNGKRFNLLETHSRPVMPSEKLGYTTTHPNCICTWKIMENLELSVDKVTKNEQSDINKIENHITQTAKKGKLHTIKKDGTLSKTTTKKNPLKELCSCMNVTLPFKLELPKIKVTTFRPRKSLQEAINNLRSEFEWLTDDYIKSAKKLSEDAGGKLYLIRAAGETITDHTGEGEPYRRKLSSDELNSMTRTIIGKSMDINHQPEYKVDSTILDAEFDKNRKEMQTLVIVKDSQINDAINNGKISAVSINGGMPRSESIEPCENGCTDDSCELCLVPKGVVLGELDGIGMTFVITDPKGLYWNGHHIKSAEPGVKFTKIETL